MSDETAQAAAENVDDVPAASDANEWVRGTLNVTVMPDSVSLHYDVRPEKDDAHVESLTASFVHFDEHDVIDHNFAGNTQRSVLATKAGQGFVGDLGVDASAFKHYHQLAAVVAGVVVDGEGTIRNYFFRKDFEIENEA